MSAMRKCALYILVTSIIIIPAMPCVAANPPPNPGQGLSGEVRTQELQNREKALRKQIQEKKKPAPVEEKIPQETPPLTSSEIVMIKTINVTGATLIQEKDIRDIVTPSEGKEIALKDMQKMADLITDIYRKKGYITSRAYLPPQKLSEGVLEIRVIEGKMGNLDIKGNYHYKTFLFKKKFNELKQNDPFNFNILSKIIRKINEQPDRIAKAVIMPGKQPGATDVQLDVKDSLPIHATLDFDNYASRYLYKDRYQMGVVDNNLFGFEDIFNLKYMLCEAQSYESLSMSYLLPITDRLKFGFYGSTGKLHLIKDAKDLGIYGESKLLSFYFNHSIVDTDNASFSIDTGFDYKDIFNYQFDNETSRDRMRVLKTDFNMDITDVVGRTIIVNEIDLGLPGFMAGSESKDPRASRPGSGGGFVKYVINLLRLQQMPFDSNILWSNQLQVSDKALTATEEYQLGGIANIRGYAPAELVGDRGFSTSIEWSCPPYFIPKDAKIPFTGGATFYNSMRLAVFYDWGCVALRDPFDTEKKFNQLSGVGWGLRINLPKIFTLRLDCAWALDKKPSDSNIQHTWISMSAKF